MGIRSPEGTHRSHCARLINYLNADLGEPFHNRITQPGLPTTNRTCLTIPALKDALRRSGLVGRQLLNNSNYELGPLCGRTDSETLDRSRTALNEYFGIIRNANLAEWESGRDGNLCTNVAVQAYTMLLASLIKYWEANTASDAREMDIGEIIVALEEYLKPVTDFLESSNSVQIKTAFHVPFGSGGLPEYYDRLCKLVKSKYSDFVPEGMEEWEEEQSEEKIQEADNKLKRIVEEMRTYIFDVFRAIHGDRLYWDRGVTDKTIKSNAYTKSLDVDTDDRLPLETYLDVLEMKKIVENKTNWPLFKAVFNIVEPGEKGFTKNLKWMDTVNELRRIPAHPARERKYKVEDFEYIDYIYQEFASRIAAAQADPVLETLVEVGEGDD